MAVGEYAELAWESIDELVREHGVAVVAGGTGLYLRAALVDLTLPPAPAPIRLSRPRARARSPGRRCG